MTKRAELDPEAKRERRRAANRRSARKTRYRENVMLEELQRKSMELSSENANLQSENDAMRELIASITRLMKEIKEEEEEEEQEGREAGTTTMATASAAPTETLQKQQPMTAKAMALGTTTPSSPPASARRNSMEQTLQQHAMPASDVLPQYEQHMNALALTNQQQQQSQQQQQHDFQNSRITPASTDHTAAIGAPQPQMGNAFMSTVQALLQTNQGAPANNPSGSNAMLQAYQIMLATQQMADPMLSNALVGQAALQFSQQQPQQQQPNQDQRRME